MSALKARAKDYHMRDQIKRGMTMTGGHFPVTGGYITKSRPVRFGSPEAPTLQEISARLDEVRKRVEALSKSAKR